MLTWKQGYIVGACTTAKFPATWDTGCGISIALCSGSSHDKHMSTTIDGGQICPHTTKEVLKSYICCTHNNLTYVLWSTWSISPRGGKCVI